MKIVLFVFFLFFACFFNASDSFAELKGKIGEGIKSSKLFDSSGKLLDNTLSNTEAITYGIAGLGLMGLGIMAFFGRFQWNWFFMLVGGLILVAGAAAGIDYLTGQNIASGVKVE